MNRNTRKPTVFISHASEDDEFVDRLGKDLELNGLSVWHDAKNLAPGALISPEISKALAQADSFIIVLSPNSIESKWVQEEWNAAFAKENSKEKSLKILPVLLKACDIPILIKGRKYIDFQSNYKQGLDLLLKAFPADGEIGTHVASLPNGSDRRFLRMLMATIVIIVVLVTIYLGMRPRSDLSEESRKFLDQVEAKMAERRYDVAYTLFIENQAQASKDPFPWMLANRLGSHFALQGNFPKAETVYEKGTEFLAPKSQVKSSFYTNYAYILLKMRSNTQANKVLQRIGGANKLKDFLVNQKEFNSAIVDKDELTHYENIIKSVGEFSDLGENKTQIQIVCIRLFEQIPTNILLGLIEFLKYDLRFHLKRKLGIETIDYEKLCQWERSEIPLGMDRRIAYLIKTLGYWRHKQPVMANVTVNIEGSKVIVDIDNLDRRVELHPVDLGPECNSDILIENVIKEIVRINNED